MLYQETTSVFFKTCNFLNYMPKTTQVFADLKIQHPSGDVTVKNDDEGNVVVHFPNRQSFISLLKDGMSLKAGNKSLRQANTVLYEQQQPVIVQVEDADWIVLGRSQKPEIKYAKVAVPYLSTQFNWKTVLMAAGGGIGAVLLYLFLRRRN